MDTRTRIAAVTALGILAVAFLPAHIVGAPGWSPSSLHYVPFTAAVTSRVWLDLPVLICEALALLAMATYRPEGRMQRAYSRPA